MKKVKIPLTTDLAGNELNISGVELGSGSPRICIQSGTHGGEITFWIIKELFNRLKNQKLKGTLVLMPNVNPVAWNQRVYFSTVGKFSLQTGEDYNRGFPGSDTSLVKRRAKKIFTNALTFNYVIDLHTSRKSVPFSITIKEKNEQSLINILGLEFNYLLSNKTDDSMMSALSTTKTKGFEIECGSHDSYEQENIDKVTKAILRFLRANKMITLEIEPSSNSPLCYTEYIKYFAETSGYVEFRIEAGQRYKKGEELYLLYPSNNYFEPISINAKEDGVVIKLLPSYIVWEGDEILQTVNKDNLTQLKEEKR